MNTNSHPITIPATEARRRFFELLVSVQDTDQTYIIEKKGKPLATLHAHETPLKSKAKEKTSQEIELLFKRIEKFKVSLSQKRGKKSKVESLELLHELRNER